MRKAILLFITLFTILKSSIAQDSIWTLEQSIAYAKEHNLDINLNQLNERLALLQLQRSKYAQLPNVNVSTGYGWSFGRSIDPTTNQFVGSSYDFANISGSADITLFGWFSQRNTIIKNKVLYEASIANQNSIVNNVSLNIANAYLRLLLSKEQITANESQLKLTAEQLAQTLKFVEAGRLPELDALQMQSKLSNDSATLFNAINSYNTAILDIKALLNIEFSAPYEPILPSLDAFHAPQLLTHTVTDIYEKAARHLGIIEANELQVKAAEYDVKIARAAYYPRLSLGAQIGTSYSSTVKEITGGNFLGNASTGQFVTINGNNYDVMQPAYDVSYMNTPFGKQLDNNQRQTVSLGLSIPILNGWNTRTNVKQAKINVQSKRLELAKAEQQLEKEIYTAYNDAKVAMQKYKAAETAFLAADKAMEMGSKRYELGLMNTVDWMITQNEKLQRESSFLSAKYDLLFKLKVIDYYLGVPIKL